MVKKKKVALTKLLFSESKLWLLDEPLNGLIQKQSILKKNYDPTHQKKRINSIF